MSWNPSPKVAAARDYGMKFGKQQVIILALGLTPDGQNVAFEVISYGQTRELCATAGRLAGKIKDAIERGDIEP